MRTVDEEEAEIALLLLGATLVWRDKTPKDALPGATWEEAQGGYTVLVCPYYHGPQGIVRIRVGSDHKRLHFPTRAAAKVACELHAALGKWMGEVPLFWVEGHGPPYPATDPDERE